MKSIFSKLETSYEIPKHGLDKTKTETDKIKEMIKTSGG